MQHYLKLFLAAALSYGAGVALLSNSLIFGVLFGIGMGVAISAIFGTLHHQAFNQLKKEADRSVYQERQIELDLSFNEAWALALEALKTLPRLTILKADLANGIIEARTGMNMLTFGERITLQLRTTSAETTALHLVSRPRMRATLIDYGRNLQHIRDLLLYVREQTATDALALERLALEDEIHASFEALLRPAQAIKNE